MASPSFRFLHAADLHLDTPFRGIRRSSEWLQTRLAEATLLAWDRLVQAALDEAVDFLVLAGDVFDHTTPSLRAQLRLRDGIARLGKAGIPVFWAHGNHDYYQSLNLAVGWPSNLIRFPAGEVGRRVVTKDGQPVCAVYGISFPTQAVTEPYAALFTRSPDDAYAVAVLHTNVGGDTQHDNYAPAQLSDLTESGFDYWALGHVHQGRVLSEHPPVIYPGNLQGRHPRETGPKGAYLVEVDHGETQWRFLPLASLRWAALAVDCTGLETADQVEEAVSDAMGRVVLAPNEEGLLCRVSLTGTTLLYQLDPEEWHTLGERLSSEGDVPGFRWVESVTPILSSPVSDDLPREGLWADVLEAVQAWSGDPRELPVPWPGPAPGYGLESDSVRRQVRWLLARAMEEELNGGD